VLGRVASCWEDARRSEVARQVHPQLVRDGELLVSVDHPAWATSFELAGSTVLSRLAQQSETWLRNASASVCTRASRR